MNFIPSTSQRKVRKKIFTNLEKETPNKKFQQKSKSFQEISEQENESKHNQQKIRKMKEKCREQNSNESVSDTETSMSIFNLFRLDRYYLPGNKFWLTFINRNVDSTKRKKQEKNLDKRLKNLEENLKL